MAWFRKKPDPISDRARALNDEIARLDAQIKELGAQLQHGHSQPRLRSTALPHGSTVSHAAPTPPASPAPAATGEPIFEEVAQDLLKPRSEDATTPEHYNELGVRKYDLPALVRRIRDHFRGPSTTNPKLVSYLAAGGIQGLRPLRYEKRVARNRFIASVVFLFLLLLGTYLVFRKGH
ncbi:MAG: hypothetical protein ACLQU3_15200 [Limisphaerales bacterium]